MKTKMKLAFSLAGAIALTTTVLAANGNQFGTDILHYTVATTMTNEGLEPDARGTVSGWHKAQGNADVQRLDIVIHGLNPQATYEIDGLVKQGTNLVVVTGFTTGTNGTAALHYFQAGHGHGHQQLPP